MNIILTVFTVTSVPIICPSLALSSALSICPTVKAYISVTMGRILIKLGENVGTLVLFIVLKFNCATLPVFFMAFSKKIQDGRQNVTTSLNEFCLLFFFLFSTTQIINNVNRNIFL